MTNELIEPFLFHFNRVHGQLHRMTSMDEVKSRLQHIAAGTGSSQAVVAAAHPDFQTLGGSDLRLEFREADKDDRISLTRPAAGIAETGSLVFFSSAQNPASLNFVPETQVAVLRESEIVPRLEDAWRLLNKQKTLPSTVNLITGPSRTGDIEQKLYLGAHGPRALHLFFICNL